ncbi:hypothetical protein [Xanthomonas maliensis]|uniref:hypothetical protein n=1 Tax=Xanthomonas maliensis TaxID=1321368 RepID=UPI0003A90FB9|nr:hypothetical protein [Xanthomonas maliensis]KAB7764032.1 hypothetical protein CKY51_18175 [Xanthomonas maliensis]
MIAACPHLQPLCVQALQAGCHVRDVSQASRARRMVAFSQPLPAALRNQGRRNPDLAYYRVPASPHWPGDEGFFCEPCLVGLTFPLH